MNSNKLLLLLLIDELLCLLTCDPELFPFLDAFPPSVPDDSFLESEERVTERMSPAPTSSHECFLTAQSPRTRRAHGDSSGTQQRHIRKQAEHHKGDQ